MFTDFRSVQILISLLKKYDINDLVIAPGTRHMPLVHSAEQDSYFQCYSVTDERSAGFFALGLIQELHKPVAVCCTSGTAVINLMSAVNEAKFQRLPLLILTADRSEYLLDQYQDQMAPTNDLYSIVCKKSISLPLIHNKKDEWRCMLSINQTLSELEHNYPGPVNINFQVSENDVFSFNTSEIPEAKRIYRYSGNQLVKIRDEIIEKLNKAEKVLIICGQHKPFNKKEVLSIRNFISKYNCVILSDNISNFHFDDELNPGAVCTLAAADSLRKLVPDILITFGGHSVNNYSRIMDEKTNDFEHWSINEDGEFIDTYYGLTDVYECNSDYFFDLYAGNTQIKHRKNNYLKEWNELSQKFTIPDFEYSDIFSAQKLINNIPENSLLHIANSISVRYSQLFHCHETVRISCNRGCNGIDGSMSTFIGAAAVCDQLSYLLIGDLSFFYDMNALWNRYLGKNIRILLNNNFGGMIFNSHKYWKPYAGVNNYTAAEHDTTARNWCESRGFKYLSAKDKEDFDSVFPDFMTIESDSPIILEVFTDKKSNDRIFTEFFKNQREITTERVVKHIKSKISNFKIAK